VLFQRTGLQKLTRRLGASIFLLLFFWGTNIQAGEPTPEIEVFVRAGCPHCETAKAFLKQLQRERPAVRILIYDIAEDSTARKRLATLAAERGIANIGVPTFRIGAELIVGFLSAETTGTEILARLDQRAQSAVTPAAVESIQAKWFGELRVKDLGLPLFTIIIGLVGCGGDERRAATQLLRVKRFPTSLNTMRSRYLPYLKDNAVRLLS
jgi:glutaredoxin